MFKRVRPEWLIVFAVLFLAVAAAIAQIVTAQGEEASGVRHIIRTNASGELVIAGGGGGEVEGTISDGGAAGTQKPVSIGGVDGSANVQRMLIDPTGRLIVLASPAYPVHVEGTTTIGNPPGGQEPVTVGGVDGAGNIQRMLVQAGGEVETQGQGTTADGAAFSDNPVVVAGVDGFGNVQQLGVSTTGVLATAAILTATDGSSNTAGGRLRTGLGAGVFQMNYPFHFNGVSWDRKFVCSESAPISTVGGGTTEIIALSGTTVIRICHVSLSWDAAVDFRLVRGTGANCGTGTANLTADYQNTTALALDFGVEAALRATAGDAVCMTQTGVGNSGGVVIYAQF